jgi:hypothetical protein
LVVALLRATEWSGFSLTGPSMSAVGSSPPRPPVAPVPHHDRPGGQFRRASMRRRASIHSAQDRFANGRAQFAHPQEHLASLAPRLVGAWVWVDLAPPGSPSVAAAWISLHRCGLSSHTDCWGHLELPRRATSLAGRAAPQRRAASSLVGAQFRLELSSSRPPPLPRLPGAPSASSRPP